MGQSCAARSEKSTVRVATRILAVLALAALLGGCDKCGNWFFGLAAPMGLDACRPTTPPQK
jgi:hypothetical protein